MNIVQCDQKVTHTFFDGLIGYLIVLKYIYNFYYLNPLAPSDLFIDRQTHIIIFVIPHSSQILNIRSPH